MIDKNALSEKLKEFGADVKEFGAGIAETLEAKVEEHKKELDAKIDARIKESITPYIDRINQLETIVQELRKKVEVLEKK